VKRFHVVGLTDIEAIERYPYDEVMPFDSVYGVICDSASRFADRTALTFLNAGDPAVAPTLYRYSDLLGKIIQTANFFRSLGVEKDRSVAFLLPSIPSRSSRV
jgi:fatty-acyl-CoA synthase